MSGIKKRLSVAALGSTAIALSLLGAPSLASAAGHRTPHSGESRAQDGGSVDDRASQDFDRRRLTGKPLAHAEAELADQRSQSGARFYAGLGAQAVVDLDPLTGTPRQLTRLDGYLSGPTAGGARDVALGFVRSHLTALGLVENDLSTLVFRNDYVDTLGIHHLAWEQRVDGTPVFGNGLQVKVTKAGRVLSVLGSPVSGLLAMQGRARAGELAAEEARTRAAKDVDESVQSSKVAVTRTGPAAETTWANHDYATKVWFLTADGLRPAWSTYVQTADGAYQHVIDAVTGSPLYRHATTDHATGDAYVYRNYPGAPDGPTGVKGGKPITVNFIKRGWLTKNSSVLDGTSVITWADLNDDNVVNRGEQTSLPGNKQGATGALKSFAETNGEAGGGPFAHYDFSKFCTARFVCSWDAQQPYSWAKNLQANENNAFYLASAFHDYLQNDGAIGFTPQAGNFTAAGGDPVLQQVLDGAATDEDEPGFPSVFTVNNANMSTPPDGTPPSMQMYLWHTPRASNDDDHFLPTSGAFDASVLLHEYTHGLSNRLVVDAGGNSTLNSLQGGSMGEAWSDYYAMDYLVTKHFEKDTAADGQVFEARYVMGDQTDPVGNRVPFRSMALDCSVGSQHKNCWDTYNPDANLHGGYTYGDLGRVAGFPEVHASGEVWAQTLWDLRKALGHTVADTLITRAMSLSAADPSMLDVRNAMLQADQVGYGGSHTHQLWQVFAKRGMGYYAASVDGNDVQVAEDFHVAPDPKLLSSKQFISGAVTDADSGEPAPGVTVRVVGFDSTYQDVTGADGTYSIGGFTGMYPGTYPKVLVEGASYLPQQRSVTVPRGDHAVADFQVVRDWAISSGGAQVVESNGPDFTVCRPVEAIDGDFGTVWSTSVGNDQADPTGTFLAKHIVVKLPRAIDVTGFGVDPAAGCGDGPDSATGDYSIEVSPDGQSWSPAADGHFGLADQGRLNRIPSSGATTGTQYVRFTIKGDQLEEVAAAQGDSRPFREICEDPETQLSYSGCLYADLTELVVFGTSAD